MGRFFSRSGNCSCAYVEEPNNVAERARAVPILCKRGCRRQRRFEAEPSKQNHQGQRRGQRKTERRRREDRELNLPSSSENFVGAKTSQFNSSVGARERSWVISSLLEIEILHEQHFLQGSGPSTFSDRSKKIVVLNLYFHLLVVLQQCTSKSSRVRSRAGGREYIDMWKHVCVLWSLLTFLEGAIVHIVMRTKCRWPILMVCDVQ